MPLYDATGIGLLLNTADARTATRSEIQRGGASEEQDARIRRYQGNTRRKGTRECMQTIQAHRGNCEDIRGHPQRRGIE